MARKSYNWEEIRTKWETGKYTMQDLADEYGFSARTGYKKSSAEDWQKGRTEHKLQNMLEEKILDNEAQVRKQTRLEYYMIFSQLREKIADEALNKENPDKGRIKTLKLAMEALSGCKKAEWDILMLEQNLKNFSAKYRLEKREVVEVLVDNPNLRNSLKELYRKSKGSNRDQVIDITKMAEKEDEKETVKVRK